MRLPGISSKIVAIVYLSITAFRYAQQAPKQGQVVGPGDPYAQAAYILRKIERALKEAGAGLEHVVRTRMFVTNAGLWEEVGRAHHECFANVLPALTLVEVSRLLDPEMLVEIEVDAVIAEEL